MAQVTEIIQCGRNNPFVVYSRYGVAIKRASPYISSPGMELFPRGSPVSTQNTQYTRRVQMIDRNDSQNGRICSPSVGITGVRFDPLVCVEDLSNFRGRVTRIYASHRICSDNGLSIRRPSSIWCWRSTNWTSGNNPDSKVHGANMGPIWGRQDPGGPHVGPMKFSIWEASVKFESKYTNFI